MKTLYQALLFAVVLISCYACGPIAPKNPRYINAPQVQSPVFFREKGDMKASLTGSYINEKQKVNGKVKEYAISLDPQVAYAFHNRFFVSLGGSYKSEEDIYSDNDITGSESAPTQIAYNRKSVDIAFGHFMSISERRKAFFTTTLGFNAGNFHSSLSEINTADAPVYYFHANTYKYYLTPSVDFYFSPYVRMSLGSRFSLLNFGSIRTNYSENNLSHVALAMLYGKTFTVVEPNLSLQFGFKKIDWLKLDIVLQGALPPRNPEYYYDNLRSRNYWGSVGFSFYPNLVTRNP